MCKQCQWSSSKRMSIWMKSNGLTPNFSKTQLLPITRSRRAPTLNINISRQCFQPYESVKYMGVTISTNLSWSQHTTLTENPNNILAWFTGNSTSPQTGFAIRSILQLSCPKLEYYASVWDPQLVKDIHAIKSVQKFATGVISHEWKSDYPSLHAKLNWQTLTT